MKTETNLIHDKKYVLDKKSTGCYIKVDKFSIRIARTDEGVVADIYEDGLEMEGSISSTYAFNSELQFSE